MSPPLSPSAFRWRVFHHLLWISFIMTVALGIGVVGYHVFGKLSWIDSMLNASMILGGMGPVDPLPNDAAKLFASFYALFSGVVFIGVAGLLIAPYAHRMLHLFHWDDEPSASN